jgi:hypothetical protein
VDQHLSMLTIHGRCFFVVSTNSKVRELGAHSGSSQAFEERGTINAPSKSKRSDRLKLNRRVCVYMRKSNVAS